MINVNAQGVGCPLFTKNMTQGTRLHAVCSVGWPIGLNADPILNLALQNSGLRVSSLRNVSLFSQFE